MVARMSRHPLRNTYGKIIPECAAFTSAVAVLDMHRPAHMLPIW